MKILKGFTLAEILVTLSILGVIAAMAIPSVIQNYKEKATVVKLKRVYSQLQQAYDMAFVYYGPVVSWDSQFCGGERRRTGQCKSSKAEYIYNAKSLVLGKFLPLSNKKCTQETETNGTTILDDCYLSAEDDRIKFMNGITDTGWGGYLAYWSVSRFLLKDGTFIAMEAGTNILVDINGKKGPNQIGRDIFQFRLYDKGIVPYVSSYDTCTSYGGVTKWVIEKGNMRHLHSGGKCK